MVALLPPPARMAQRSILKCVKNVRPSHRDMAKGLPNRLACASHEPIGLARGGWHVIFFLGHGVYY